MAVLRDWRVWAAFTLLGVALVLLMSMPLDTLPLAEFLLVLVITKAAALLLGGAALLILRRALR